MERCTKTDDEPDLLQKGLCRIFALFGHGAMSDLSPLWMAPALQEIN
jgi:hypothetical protein